MMKRRLLLLLLAAACFIPTDLAYAQVKDSVLQFQISDLLKSSALAWNRGDLDAFMNGYLDSEQSSFTSAGQILRGRTALRERYEKLYSGDKQAMGQLSFSDIEVWRLGEHQALVLGRWKLQPEKISSRKPSEGVFSLVMLEVNGSWKIFHDHTSTMESR